MAVSKILYNIYEINLILIFFINPNKKSDLIII